MSKNIKKRIKKIGLYITNEPVEFFLAILFWICVYLSIRWSTISCFGILRNIEIIFVPTNNVDGAMLNLVTGCATGYFVYYLSVRRPVVKKREPIRKLVNQELISIYNQSIILLLLLCKCTATKEEWEKVVKEKDLDCFNDNYYEVVKKFDLRKDAYTLLLHKKTKKTLAWGEYLYEHYKKMQKQIKKILQNEIYLEDGLLVTLKSILGCHYIELFLGESVNTQGEFTKSNSTMIYYENYPLHMFYTQESNLSPFLGDSNISILKEYINELSKLYHFLEIRIENNTNKANHSIDADYSIKMINKKDVGEFEQARI